MGRRWLRGRFTKGLRKLGRFEYGYPTNTRIENGTLVETLGIAFIEIYTVAYLTTLCGC